VRGAAAVLEQESPVETDERYTPFAVLQLVRQVAPIGLDPCTTMDNRTGARRFFTSKEDGLAQSWLVCPRGELVYVNPPYSRGQLARWTAKIVDGWHESHTEIIALTPCDLGTKWATELFKHADAFAGWRGRISFVKPDGSYDTGAKQPSILWYFGERATRFMRAFELHANVVNLHGGRS
jgi:hypothetical protein